MQLFKSRRRLILFGVDIIILTFVYLLTSALMYIARDLYLEPLGYVVSFAVFVVCIVAARIAVGVYSNVWRYANATSYMAIVAGDVIGGVVAISFTLLPFADYFRMGAWQSVAFVCMADVATLVSRFAYQISYKWGNRERVSERNSKIGVAIVGAGQVGALLAEELIYNRNSHYTPVCFIDKNKDKVGSRVCGLDVYSEDGAIQKIKSLPVQEIFIALPKISGEQAGALHEYYARTGCKVKLYDFPIMESEASDGKRIIREFKIEDLLFRGALDVFGGEAAKYYRDRVVLVTGGGGSIGSELCRQIAAAGPKRLIIFDIYENNAYDIQQELIRKYGESLALSVEIGSVRDRARLEAVFSHYRPEIVFHAAAHKHVPLMEHSSAEAVKNNVFGTYNTADMAEKYGVERFILISTDKAVNPTNVMGASKRLCEMVIQCRTDSATAFAAVRFGNVLGSNGSVIPLFKHQIENGGPVTVTDKRIIRYFMTIPEASGLVMQAGAMARGGDLFVLDMGKPVKIIDLAENMVRLSGLVPYVDIDIVETGLRPGEKLYEELLIKTETLTKTANDMIFIERDTPHTREEVEAKLSELERAVIDSEGEIGSPRVKEAMKRVVPTFHDPEEVNLSAQESEEMRCVGV